MQCGPATLTLKLDKERKLQVLATSGLPDGIFALTVKDGEIYVGGHMCKPICDTSAERRC